MRNPTPPGSTILDILVECGMTQVELSEKMKRPKKTINEIIKGKTRITSETAIQLEKYLKVEAEFWVIREALFRLKLARKRK